MDVIGRAKARGGWIFVPALLDGEFSPRIAFTLADHLGRVRPPTLAMPAAQGCDILWVRARLPVLFHFAPPSCAGDARPYFLEVPFLAVGKFEGEEFLQACPFVLSNDEDLHAGLRFALGNAQQERKQQLAYAFWSLLLEAPEELSAFDDYLAMPTHDGTAYQHVGYDKFGFFNEFAGEVSESRENVDVDWCEVHQGFGLSYFRWCLDCNGTGYQSIFPVVEFCETCKGSGQVTW